MTDGLTDKEPSQTRVSLPDWISEFPEVNSETSIFLSCSICFACYLCREEKTYCFSIVKRWVLSLHKKTARGRWLHDLHVSRERIGVELSGDRGTKQALINVLR